MLLKHHLTKDLQSAKAVLDTVSSVFKCQNDTGLYILLLFTCAWGSLQGMVQNLSPEQWCSWGWSGHSTASASFIRRNSRKNSHQRNCSSVLQRRPQCYVVFPLHVLHDWLMGSSFREMWLRVETCYMSVYLLKWSCDTSCLLSQRRAIQYQYPGLLPDSLFKKNKVSLILGLDQWLAL
jgi:hypothetical protein